MTSLPNKMYKILLSQEPVKIGRNRYLESDEGVFPLDPNLLQLAGVILFADWIFTSGVFRLDSVVGVPELWVLVARKSLLLP